MIDWLLKGKPIKPYPYWSRAIVCGTQEEVVRVTGLLREATADMEGVHVWDLRKCVWGVKDLHSVYIHHSGLLLQQVPFEVAVDNLDILLAQWLGWTPALVTMTGELYDNVPHDTAEDGASPS